MMVSPPRKCSGLEGKVCGRFLPAENHDPLRLCVSCRGKSCTVDDHCAECAEWSEKHCSDVAAYTVKLSVQREKKRERKANFSSSSSYSSFSPSIPVPLNQLALTSGVIFTSASLTPVCSVMYAVAGPAVSAVAMFEQPRKRRE